MLLYFIGLYVYFTVKPQFVNPSDHTVDVIEGQPAIINMTARSNPAELTYAWFRDGNSIKNMSTSAANPGDRIVADGSLLNLTVVRRSDTGEFKCVATSVEGSTAAVVRLNVQCKEGY